MEIQAHSTGRNVDGQEEWKNAVLHYSSANWTSIFSCKKWAAGKVEINSEVGQVVTFKKYSLVYNRNRGEI